MLAAMTGTSGGERAATAQVPERPTGTAALLLSVTRWVPAVAIEPAARLLAWVYRALAPRKLRRAMVNLEIAFGDQMSERQRRELARASLVHQAASLIETARELQQPGSVVIQGHTEFARRVAALEQGSGGQLLITAHLGSWELLNRAATLVATRGFFALAKQPQQVAANSFLDALRLAAGTRVLASGAKSTLRRMLEVLNDGGWLGLAMDQKPEGAGIPVPFFGLETEFVVGPANLIQRQGCRVLAAFCVREGRGRYRLAARQVEFEPGTSREEITRRLAAELEAMIRAHPEQWLWTYRRWPDLPPARRRG